MERWAILMRDTSLAPMLGFPDGPFPVAHMPSVCQAAAQQGWELLFQCSAEPDQEEVLKCVQEGRGIAALSYVEMLYDLR